MIIMPKPPKKPARKQFYPIFRGMLFGLIFAGLFSGVFYVFATYGSDEPYPLGNTLTPTCTPGATYCTVVTPAYFSFGSNNFSGTGNFSGGTITGTAIINSGLTSGRVTFATTSGQLSDDVDLTFAADTLTATKLVASTSISTPSIITASGALGITPAAGSNLNVSLFTTGDFSVNTSQLYIDTSAGNVGIGTTSPTYLLSLGGDAAREIWMERNTTTSGSNLTLSAGGGLSGGTNLNGGSLYLSSGISTGSGSSDMFFQTATAGASAATDRTPSTKFTVRGNGNVVIGTGTALATNATGGFLYIPTSAGTPTGVPVTDTTGTVPIEYDTTNHLLYLYRDSVWHYFAETGGFQIPDYETTDPISGEKIKEGDIVLGMINQTMPNDNLHGVWVTWDSVKKQLLAEARGELSKSGAWGAGTIEGVGTETFLDKVKNVLFSFGITVEDGLVRIARLAVEKLSVKNARVETLEMVDKATGEIYCSWIENGEWVKAKGECGSIEAATAQSQIVNQVALQAQQAARQAARQVQDQIQKQVQREVQQQLEAQQPAQGENSENPQIDTQSAPEPAVAPQEVPAVEEPPVPEQPAPAEASPVSFIGNAIRNSTAGLLNATWEFAKWIFGISFNGASKIIPESIEKLSASILDADFQTIFSGIKMTGAALYSFLKKI